jgi:hypothetical protein
MRKSLLPEKYHYFLYIFALAILVIGMPVSKFLMSLAQIILVCNWVLEGNLISKLGSFFKNKAALVLSSLLLLHFIGLIYSTDFNYAFNDIRIKGPLLILPLILSTSKPLSKETVNVILRLFISSVLVGTLISILILTGIIHRQVVDIRAASIFISHIRFALLICVAIFTSGYFFYLDKRPAIRLVWFLIICWLIIFLMIMQSLSGLSALFFATFILLIYYLIRSSNKIVKYVGLTSILVFIAGSFYFINKVKNDTTKIDVVDFSKLEKLTSHGNEYQNEPNSKLAENGHLIWINFSPKELEEAWNKRSKIKYNEKDLKGNEISFTIARFLTSKNLKKDEDAVNSLSNEEVAAIERGVVNVNYQNISGLEGRLHEIFWELDLYETTGDPNGHSLTQRFEFWKAALGIIKENMLIGVGTGDLEIAFDKQYNKMNSPLLKEWRLHSHNQYLSFAVTFGILGLLWFLITLIYPMIICKKMFDYLYITFFMIAAVSFFTEDTLETQAGVTFYAFFNSFFLFVNRKEEKTTSV